MLSIAFQRRLEIESQAEPESSAVVVECSLVMSASYPWYTQQCCRG